MPRIHINIGSNKGDRAALIERAVAALCSRIDPAGNAVIHIAPIIESEPWGFVSDNRFFNLGLMVDLPAEVNPHEILAITQCVEKEIADAKHRNPDGSYADRLIDIDLIAIDDIVVDTPDLQLPHPRMSLRPFVLEPVAILDPQWKHPLIGLTAFQMLESCCAQNNSLTTSSDVSGVSLQ